MNRLRFLSLVILVAGPAFTHEKNNSDEATDPPSGSVSVCDSFVSSKRDAEIKFWGGKGEGAVVHALSGKDRINLYVNGRSNKALNFWSNRGINQHFEVERNPLRIRQLSKPVNVIVNGKLVSVAPVLDCATNALICIDTFKNAENQLSDYLKNFNSDPNTSKKVLGINCAISFLKESQEQLGKPSN